MKTLFSSYIGAFIVLAVLASASWSNGLHLGYSIPLTVGAIAVFVAWRIEREVKWFLPRSMVTTASLCILAATVGLAVEFDIPGINGTWGIPPWLAGCLLGAALILFVLAYLSYRAVKDYELREKERLRALKSQAQSGYGPQIGAATGAVLGSFLGPLGTATGAALGAGIGGWLSAPTKQEDDSAEPQQSFWEWLFGGKPEESTDRQQD